MSSFLKLTGKNELEFKKKLLQKLQTFSFFGTTFFDIKVFLLLPLLFFFNYHLIL